MLSEVQAYTLLEACQERLGKLIPLVTQKEYFKEDEVEMLPQMESAITSVCAQVRLERSRGGPARREGAGFHACGDR